MALLDEDGNWVQMRIRFLVTEPTGRDVEKEFPIYQVEPDDPRVCDLNHKDCHHMAVDQNNTWFYVHLGAKQLAHRHR